MAEVTVAPDSGKIQMSNIPITCPGCWQISASLIYLLCEGGHTLCEDCRLRLSHCPVCQHPMTNTRNFIAEQMAQQFLLDKYKQLGCPHNLTPPEIQGHLAICEIRPIVCELPRDGRPKCLEVFNPRFYLEHVLTAHYSTSLSLTFTETFKKTFTQTIPFRQFSEMTCRDMPPAVHIRDEERDFLLVTGVYNMDTPCWSLYVFDDSVVEDEDNPNPDHYVGLTIQHPISKAELTFRSFPIPIRMTMQEVFGRSKAFTITTSMFKGIAAYCQEQDNLYWNVIITFGRKKINENENRLPEVDTASWTSVTSSDIGLFNETMDMERALRLDDLEWPLSAEPSKVIDIAIRTHYANQYGVGLCILRGMGKATLYDLYSSTYSDKAANEREFEAENAIQVVLAFLKYFTPRAKVFFSVENEINIPGKRDGPQSLVNQFLFQIDQIRKEMSGMNIIFRKFEPARVENKAARKLMVNEELCHEELQRAGIIGITNLAQNTTNSPDFGRKPVTKSMWSLRSTSIC